VIIPEFSQWPQTCPLLKEIRELFVCVGLVLIHHVICLLVIPVVILDNLAVRDRKLYPQAGHDQTKATKGCLTKPYSNIEGRA
jgi:hypothetical protein